MKNFRHAFLPNTGSQQGAEMLAVLGIRSIDELFQDIPSKFRLNRPLKIPEGMSEAEVCRRVEELLGRNGDPDCLLSFLGGGVWPHLVPEVVETVVGRTEFLTAYTPYQPEISQGMLQALFEYQSLMAELLDMPVVNASLYDWASALGEAALMAGRLTGRRVFLVPEFMSPERLAVLRTYTEPAEMDVKTVACDPERGCLDLEQLKGMVEEDTAGVYLENPAFLGYLDPQVEAIADIAHDKGAKLVVGVDPISLGVVRPPGDYGADIVVGEGQPLGNRINFGGPLLGVFACRDDRKSLRQLPGRIIGLTTTLDGSRRGFVMTLQTREQHIRRERATSNICSNEALCAVAAAVYLCLMGPEGLRRLGEQIMQLRSYAEKQIDRLEGVTAPRFNAPHFKEFVFTLQGAERGGEEGSGSSLSIRRVLERVLRDAGVLGGLPLDRIFPRLGQSALVCVTEVHTKEDVDRLVAALESALEVA